MILGKCCMAKKLKTLVIILALLSPVGGILAAGTVAADCSTSSSTTCTPVTVKLHPVDCPSGQVDSTGTACVPLGNGCNGDTSNNACLKNSPLTQDLNNIIDFLSGGVGIIVVGVIMVGGIQYSIAGDNPQAVTAAKKRITDGLLALVVFMLLFAFVQWLVPGGIFS
jgi:hypothetical protein